MHGPGAQVQEPPQQVQGPQPVGLGQQHLQPITGQYCESQPITAQYCECQPITAQYYWDSSTCSTMGSCSGGVLSSLPWDSHTSKAVSCSSKKLLGT